MIEIRILIGDVPGGIVLHTFDKKTHPTEGELDVQKRIDDAVDALIHQVAADEGGGWVIRKDHPKPQ